VAIDWEDAGRGALGQELASLTVASLFFFEVELVKAQELDGIVFAGYLEGLVMPAGRAIPDMCGWAIQPMPRCVTDAV
jgi:hypothetical protein